MTAPDAIDQTCRASRGGLLLPLVAITLVVLAAALLAIAGFGTRLGLWHFRTGFDLLKYGAYCGVVALFTAVAATVYSVRKRRVLGGLLALLAVIGALAAAGVPLSWKLTAQKLPRIHDITTDFTNPPALVALLPLRQGAPNPATYGGAEVAEQQRKGYPDIKTIVVDFLQPKAFEKALAAAGAMGWQIVAAVPQEGRIEATDTTFWFGFKDDIVIRVVPAGNRSLVDVRSVSRLGVSDVGKNAQRIRSYARKLVN